MKKIANHSEGGGFTPTTIMLRILIVFLLVFSIGVNANRRYELTVPVNGDSSYNNNFFFCTIASDEALLKIVNAKRRSAPKHIAMKFVDINFANTLFYDFYVDMVEYVYAKESLNLEEDSDIFFTRCMSMAYQ